MKKPKAQLSSTDELFTEHDWNFDDVPDDELAACCLWEYGRESLSFSISGARQEEMRASGRLEFGPDSTPDPDYERFLGKFWDCDEGFMAFYETIRNYGGSGALPWQSIAVTVRQSLKMQVGVHEIGGPCEPALRRELEALWKSNLKDWEPTRNKPGYDADEDKMAWESSAPHIGTPGHSGETHGETMAAFTIDFRKFNNQQICTAFLDWLKANRPEDCPERFNRGRKLKDSRVALDRLGMMRLLHRFTLREMPLSCPKAWKLFAGYDWYKERKRAEATFRKLSPFLDQTEKPLSWPTKGGRGK